MNDMIEWSLQDYAKEINEQYDVLLRAEEVAENAVFRIGELLNAVKNKLPHGQFIPWIEANCRFNRRWANKLMLIESRREEFIEPPTNITKAYDELKLKDQMSLQGPISSPAIPYQNPRGKLYKKLHELHAYVIQIEEEGYDKYMVIEDEAGTTAELILRLMEVLRRIENKINPSHSHIREVKP